MEHQELVAAFEQLQREAVHPSAEEIDAAMEGTGSLFTLAETRAHIGWCEPCRRIADDFREFCTPAVADPVSTEAEWRVMQKRLPTPIRRPAGSQRLWLAAAAGFAACFAGATFWWSTRPEPPPVIVERRIAVPAKPEPILVANAAVIDLLPMDARVRGATEALRPVALPGIVTLILSGADIAGDRAEARAVDATGREIWRVTLLRQRGVFTFALGGDALAARPVTIELGTAGNRLTIYRLP